MGINLIWTCTSKLFINTSSLIRNANILTFQFRNLNKKLEKFSEYEFILENVEIQQYLSETLKNLHNGIIHSNKSFGHLQQLFQKKSSLEECIRILEEMRLEKLDNELEQELLSEKNTYSQQLLNIEVNLLKSLLPDNCNSNGFILELSPGVGGQEAMLFAGDLMHMYSGYLDFRGWEYIVEGMDSSDLGGVRHASLIVNSKDSFQYFQYECGVHRVQRIPFTEKSGRIHTSTVTVAVLPQPSELDLKIYEKDIHIETKRSSGPGGQHVNKTESAVRITHIPTATTVECQADRSQIKNKEIAMMKLKAKLYEVHLQKQNFDIKKLRKSQVGTAARSEKVRTYNFSQDRITDHRLGKNFYNIEEFLKGGCSFNNFLNELVNQSEKDALNNFIKNIRGQ